MYCAWRRDAKLNGYRDRNALEQNLAGALSRQIGYTTGAYYLDRITSVLGAFERSPTVYLHELVDEAARAERDGGCAGHAEEERASKPYLEEVVHFAEAMNIIIGVSQPSARVRRFAPTELGRALSGAKATGDGSFYEHLLFKNVLLADADALYPVMSFYSQTECSELQDYYRGFQIDLRNRRMEWIIQAFTERASLERVVARVGWLGIDRTKHWSLFADYPSRNTARHHATPRKGWLIRLGVLGTGEECLTEFGELAKKKLQGKGAAYFWLGPKQTTQQDLGIRAADQARGPYEDSFEITHSTTVPDEEEIVRVVDDTADIMKAGYSSVKLVHASQATLMFPIEYIKYRRALDRRSYDWNLIIPRVFSRHRDGFDRLSPKRGHVGFYRWKGGAH